MCLPPALAPRKWISLATALLLEVTLHMKRHKDHTLYLLGSGWCIYISELCDPDVLCTDTLEHILGRKLVQNVLCTVICPTSFSKIDDVALCSRKV